MIGYEYVSKYVKMDHFALNSVHFTAKRVHPWPIVSPNFGLIVKSLLTQLKISMHCTVCFCIHRITRKCCTIVLPKGNMSY